MTKGWKLVSKLGAAAALAAAFLTVACDGATRADEDGSVVSVEVNAPASELEAGTSAQFEAVLRNRKGEPVTGRGVAWSSTDSAVAAVSAVGVVSARSAGQARIQATSGGRSGSAQVRVRAVRAPVNAVVITSAAVVTLEEGGSVRLYAEVRAANDSLLVDREVSWGSSDSSVAVVSATGDVTARVAGETRVWASAELKSDTVTVQVRPAYQPVVRLEPVTEGVINLVIGGTRQLGVRMFAADGREIVDRAVNWTSSAPGVASVSGNGVVTGHDAGGVTITARVDDATLSLAVDVRSSVTRVGITPGRADLAVGDTLRFQATPVGPAGEPLARPVRWSSSDTTVARVDSLGLLTAVSAGSVHVIATVDGEQAFALVSIAPWVGHVLELIEGATLPQLLWSSTAPDGVLTTVTATSGRLRMATTGINSGRYEQEFWVGIQSGSNMPQVGAYVFGGTWSYEHVSSVYTFVAHSGETLTATRTPAGGFQLRGRLFADRPTRLYEYSAAQ